MKRFFAMCWTLSGHISYRVIDTINDPALDIINLKIDLEDLGGKFEFMFESDDSRIAMNKAEKFIKLYGLLK